MLRILTIMIIIGLPLWPNRIDIHPFSFDSRDKHLNMPKVT